MTATARIHWHGPARHEQLRWATRNPRRRRRLRREADRLLRAGVTPRPSSRLLATRASELTSARERHLLVRSLHAVLRELSGATLPGPSPLNRAGVRPYVSELAALAYDGEDELPSWVDDALAALDDD